jgi:hypothetical protein
MGIDPKFDRGVELGDITFFFSVQRVSGSGFRPRLTNPCQLSDVTAVQATVARCAPWVRRAA